MIEKGDIDYSYIGLAYSVGLSDELRTEMEAYARELGFKEIAWTKVGGVISSHCGLQPLRPHCFRCRAHPKAQGVKRAR